MGVVRRGNKLYLRYRDAFGNWRTKASGLDVGQERAAQKMLERLDARIRAGLEVDGSFSGPLTVRRYAESWLGKRRERGLLTKDTETHLREHVLPRIGSMPLHEVRPRHLRQLIDELRRKRSKSARSKGQVLKPRTVRHVYSTTRNLFADAAVDELIDQTPAILKPHHLPPDVDGDPNWREGATFERREVITLLSDQRIPQSRRVLYAMLALGGPRLSACVVRRWQDVDLEAKPLGKLALRTKWRNETKREVVGTKTGTVRYVPVHPTLARLLREWKLSGWHGFAGRHPTDIDLIVPSRRGGILRPHNVWPALQRDLRKLGLRPRRVHDLRAAFISLARADGARPDIIKWISHGPSKRQIVDVYTRLPWEVLCAEVARVNLALPRANVVAISGATE